MPERLVAQVVQLAAGQHALERQVHRLRDVPRHFLVVAGDDLELHAALRQIDDDLLHIGLGRIEEEQEAGEGESRFHRRANRLQAVPSIVFVATPEHAEALFAPVADSAVRSLPAVQRPADGLHLQI